MAGEHVCKSMEFVIMSIFYPIQTTHFLHILAGDLLLMPTVGLLLVYGKTWVLW